MLKSLLEWWDKQKEEEKARRFRYYEQKFTVCCDKHRSWFPGNEREKLIQVEGLIKARRVARWWGKQHARGRAKVIEGHHSWDD